MGISVFWDLQKIKVEFLGSCWISVSQFWVDMSAECWGSRTFNLLVRFRFEISKTYWFHFWRELRPKIKFLKLCSETKFLVDVWKNILGCCEKQLKPRTVKRRLRLKNPSFSVRWCKINHEIYPSWKGRNWCLQNFVLKQRSFIV